MIRICIMAGTVACLCVLAPRWAVGAGPQDNGNTLALEYASASAGRRMAIGTNAAGRIYFFRYLRIVGIEKGACDGKPYVKLRTVEPSSDLPVVFAVEKEVSLGIVDPLKENDAVAVSGRVESMGTGTNGIILATTVVRYKDRLQPKFGKELLPEVDPSARIGTDTSSGQEVIRLKKDQGP